MFTKKHFIAIAKILQEASRSVESMEAGFYDSSEATRGFESARSAATDIVDNIEYEFIELFKQENPNFDEARFRDAVKYK